MHRKLDEVPGEMCATANEDLQFRNMRGVRTGVFELQKGKVHRMLGKRGR